MSDTKPFYVLKPFANDRQGPDAGKSGSRSDPEIVAARLLLSHYIDNPPKGSVPITIGSYLAQAMLERNTGNRFYRPSYAADLAKMMKNRCWENTGEPIVFADDGVLNDGQHRLEAVLLSGASIEADVRFGIRRSAFTKTNTGRRRTAADALHIDGAANSKHLASALGWAARIVDGKLPGGARETYTIDETMALRRRFPDIKESFTIANKVEKELGIGRGILSAVHYLTHKSNPIEADRLFHDLSSGAGLLETDAALLFRRRALRERNGKRSVQSAEWIALLIKAFNNRVHGIRQRKLLWMAGGKNPEPFPTIGGAVTDDDGEE